MNKNITKNKNLYGNDVPKWLRKIGCYRIQSDTYSFHWGEFTKRFGLSIGYNVYYQENESFFHLLFIWGSTHIKLPIFIKNKKSMRTENYGISLYENDSVHLSWRYKYKIIHFPWSWSHVRSSFLNKDGTLHHNYISYEPTPTEIVSKHNYVYVLNSGKIQERIATIHGSEMEWRWICFKKFSFGPKSIKRYMV